MQFSVVIETVKTVKSLLGFRKSPEHLSWGLVFAWGIQLLCYGMCVNRKRGFPTMEYNFCLSFMLSPVFSGFLFQFSLIL